MNEEQKTREPYEAPVLLDIVPVTVAEGTNIDSTGDIDNDY